MPMQATSNDTAGDGKSEAAGRRLCRYPPSRLPRFPSAPRRRTFTAQDKLRILAETDGAADRAGSAPSCVARGFTRRCFATGANSARPESSARCAPAPG